MNFVISQSTFGFSIDYTDHIVELVNIWFPTEKFREFDKPFILDSTY